jgi:DNA mismatch repair protein MutS2
VIQGVPGSSNAYAIAARLGIPEDVIRRARETQTGTDASVEIMQELETARRNALDDRKTAETLRKDADALHSRAESEFAKFERMRAEIRDQVLAEAREVVRSAQLKASELLRQIRDNREQEQAEQARRMIGEIEAETISAIDRTLDLQEQITHVDEEIDLPTGKELVSGDRVRVSPTGLVGTLIDDVAGRERVAVQVGSVRLLVDPESLRLLPGAGKHGEPGPAFRTRGSRTSAQPGGTAIAVAASVPPQLTLIGQRADEAHSNLERYLDDAVAAGLDRVRIVHGKGTGALRRVVQEYLRGNALVSEYATAEPDEGGSGATVVRLSRTS